ncbi:MAG: acylphosphatase [Chloroflexi bacterium]|nr:acylphosphatase [Chloroflexota bacterium]MBP7042850.1 acylphosphatase [Chloroflexota bacterium]
MDKRMEAVVYGRVQGVSFRYFTEREANRLQLSGWVANQFDGTVRVVAEGPEAQLDKLINFLHRGSPSAWVERVAIDWTEATGEFMGFKVRRI